MLIIKYTDKKAHLIADGKAEEFAAEMIRIYFDKFNKRDFTINVGTELVIMAFRVLVCEGKLHHEQIEFHYNGKVIRINKDGRYLCPPPEGFCDRFDDFLDRLLKL